MKNNSAYPRTQAELDAYITRFKRPVRDTYVGMYPLHDDMELTDEQVQIVQDYIREVDFHLPGATCEDFLVVRWARYMGFQLLSEDLESYAVGLRYTAPGMEDHNTFIRMSWGQLMGYPDAERLPVNKPVLASDMMTLAKYRDTPTGPSRTGVDTYMDDEGEPGVDFDLKLLEGAMADVIEHHDTGKGREYNYWWNPALNCGVALAGHYPRLVYFREKGRLRADQLARLSEFESRAIEIAEILDGLGLVHPAPLVRDTLKQAAKAEKNQFTPTLRIANPTPLTELTKPKS